MISVISQLDSVPDVLVRHADTIKYESYKTNKPAKFQKYSQESVHGRIFTNQLSRKLNIPSNKLDWVYFSVCQGAEPHVDQLDSTVFTNDTYIIPIIIPTGKSTLFCGEAAVALEQNMIYYFDHSTQHSLVLEDTTSGCVVIMVAVLHQPKLQLKHYTLIDEVINDIVRDMDNSWMDNAEKDILADTLLSQFGTQMDHDIEVGIQNGSSIEQQKMLIQQILKK